MFLVPKKKNFIKPQYNNSLNTQHCGRLPEKTKTGTLTKKNTEKEITYEHRTTKKEWKDSEITQYEIIQYDCDTGVSNTMCSYQFIPYRLLLVTSKFYCVIVVLLSMCSLCWFSRQYLPSDRLERLL